MPFQHIATNALQLLDTNGSGFGTVARTRSLSIPLSQRLEQFSLSLSLSAQSDAEPVFTYQIIEHGGFYHHVISRTVSCGVTADGEPNHLVHHLICTTQEVKGLLRHPSRPTPAGLALALSAADFWKNEWNTEPAILPDEFSFSARYLPDASQQGTWQDLTGHKRNARILSLPHYAKGCLILLPDSGDFSTKLMLNNESDWIAHTRGWGTTFTTHLSPFSDNFVRVYTRKSSVDEAYITNCNRGIVYVDENLLCEEPTTEQPLPAGTMPILSANTASENEQKKTLSEVPRLIYRRKAKRQRLCALIGGGVLLIGACSLLVLSKAGNQDVTDQTKSETNVPQQSGIASEQQNDAPLLSTPEPTEGKASQQETPISPDTQSSEEEQQSQNPPKDKFPDLEEEQQTPALLPEQPAHQPLRSTSTTVLIGGDKVPETLHTALGKTDKTPPRANWDWIDLNNGNLTSILRSDKINEATAPSPDRKDIVLSVTLPDEVTGNMGQRFIITPKIKANVTLQTHPHFPTPRFSDNEAAQTPSRSGASGYYRFSANQIFSEGALLIPVHFASSEPLILPVIPDRDADEPNATLVNEIVLPEGWKATLLPASNESHTAQYALSAEQMLDLTPQAETLIERVFNKTRKDRDNMPSASLAYICRMLWLIDTEQDSTAISKYLKLFANRDGKTRRYLQTLMKDNTSTNPHLTPDSRSVKSKAARARLANELKKPHAVSDLLQALRQDMQAQIEQEIKSAKIQNIPIPAPLELDSVRLEGNRLIWIFR